MTILTSASCLRSRRTNSAVLYAEIPPQTPNKIRVLIVLSSNYKQLLIMAN